MEKVSLIKEIRGLNTYKNAIDTDFHEFIVKPQPVDLTPFTVSDFFSQYDSVFYDIAVTWINSHATLVQKSGEYIGGGVDDEEKRALIEEINSLRQQIIDLTNTYLTVSTATP